MTMHSYVVVVAGALISMAVSPSVSIETCTFTGTPGLPGIPGIPGRDGRDGVKGEKGDPGVAVQSSAEGPQRGQKGAQGPPGPSGKQGPSGQRGAQGPPGEPGPAGAPPQYMDRPASQQSAFSVARRTTEYPLRATPIRFLSVITNVNEDYNPETGKYTSRIPGTYYFVFHVSAASRLCLLIKIDGLTYSSFCDQLDTRNPRQVYSGSFSIYMGRNQELWLETNTYRGLTGTPGGNSVFSGFLMYAH